MRIRTMRNEVIHQDTDAELVAALLLDSPPVRMVSQYDEYSPRHRKAKRAQLIRAEWQKLHHKGAKA